MDATGLISNVTGEYQRQANILKMIIHTEEIKSHNRGDEGNMIDHYKRHRRDFDLEHLYRADYFDDATNVLTKAITKEINIALNH